MAQSAQFNFRSADRERVLLTATREAVDMPVGVTVSDAVHAAQHNMELHGKVELLVSALRAAHGRATQPVQWPGCTIPSAAALAPVPSANTFDLPPPPKQHKAGAKSGGRGPGKGPGGRSSGADSDSNGWRRSNDSGAGRNRQGGRPRDTSSDRRQAGGHQRGGGSDQRQRGRASAAAASSSSSSSGQKKKVWRGTRPADSVSGTSSGSASEKVFLGRLLLANGMTRVFPLPASNAELGWWSYRT
ncbi:unnamed protein product [Ectocarpus sp. 12 AP-2014]